MPIVPSADQIREKTLTLLLIEREMVNEKLAALDFQQRKSPAVPARLRS